MTKEQQDKYRKTKKWTDIRKKVLKDRDYTCEMCGIRKKNRLHVHHINPEAYGNETLDDLVVLCAMCHKHAIERFLRRKEFDVRKYAKNIVRIYEGSKRHE
jgi:5-methylcytosine-specific restriction endonuclease McrA